MTDPQQGDVPDNGKERLQIGPVPDWVVPCAYRPDFKGKLPGQATYLLWSKQIHAEERRSHVHVALHLETIQAVERHSHWRLEMLPETEQITLHWIKIHRNETEFDHTSVEKLRSVQDETDDITAARKVTWGMLLEDVRPGDILEWSYTIEEKPPLRPEQCAAFFAVPAEIPLGKFYFSARFQEGRALQWKSSSDDLQPLEKIEKGQKRWIWERENPAIARREENTPEWYVEYPWIQVSDWEDWETVASAFVEAWGGEEPDADIQAVAKDIGGEPGGVLQQIEKAIHLVQEEFRHLEVEDLAGQSPAAPGVVARRRFGNALDLSFFLARLLNQFGAAAHPVLINTSFRKSLSDMLPMPGLFNHVVVEYQARNERRWVDATAKGQGGDSLNRVIPDYGFGLFLSRASARMVAAPPASISANACEIKETLLLDTEGAVSLLAVVVTARGGQAEEWRKEFDTQGPEAISRRRLQLCMDRFTDAQRTGPMEFRDDRTANEFFLAETFAIKGFLRADVKPGWYKLEVADDFAAAALKLPDPGGRRTPFALPYPCNLVHILEVHCVALPPAIIQERTIDNPWLQYTRQRKTLSGDWTLTSTLTTLTDAVPAERIEEHAQTMREIRAQSTWSLLVPAGQGRPHQRGDFGKMPVSWDTSGATTPVLRVDLTEGQNLPQAASGFLSRNREEAKGKSATSATGASVAASGPVRYKRRKRHRRRHTSTRREIIWQAVLAGVLMIVLLLLAITLAESSDRWLPHLSAPEIPKNGPEQGPSQ
ncbi:MAG: DUF3857 domain-containing protein [Limisphaerales bacterium]